MNTYGKCKKIPALIVLSVFVTISGMFVACDMQMEMSDQNSKNSQNSSLHEEPSNAVLEEDYVFTGETEVFVEDRSFVLKDIPENLIEEIVEKYFLYEITAEFDKEMEVLADIEVHRINIKNTKELFEAGKYIQSYIIHQLSIITEEQYHSEDKYWIEKFLKEHPDKPYYIVNAVFTKKLSEKAAKEAQWGDGTYGSSFIVAENDEGNYVIYEFLFMNYLNEGYPDDGK